jgi:hypothetical protein
MFPLKPFGLVVRKPAVSQRSIFMRAFTLLVALLIGLAAPARAGDDVATAQTVIRAQIDAFGRDDAAAAYSYAAPAIQSMFPQADIFLGMVKQRYAPVYRHKRFEFGEAQVSDGKIAQRAHIIDANDEAWEALYTLELEPDGSVKITGCVLLKAGQAV